MNNIVEMKSASTAKNKYYIIACHVLWRELSYYASLSENIFNFKFLDQGLHNTPDMLREKLQQTINEAQDDYSAILVGYGLCCNGVVGIKARRTRLIFMRGHDCITFLLGSKEHYREYFDKNPGTYWYSPGWIDSGSMPGEKRHEELMQSYIEKYGEDNAKYLMEEEQGWFKKYAGATYVDLGFSDTVWQKAFTKKCAEWLGWRYDEIAGSSGLIKDFLGGNWDEERFQIIEPGSKVAAANNDEKIINSA